jgi:hypothetical protein
MTQPLHISGWMPLLIPYLGIACVIGLCEYAIARHAFRNHSQGDDVSQPDMLLSCVLKHAVAWPVILFWLGMLGFLKVFILFRRRR